MSDVHVNSSFHIARLTNGGACYQDVNIYFYF